MIPKILLEFYLALKLTHCLILSFLLIASVLEGNLHFREPVNRSSHMCVKQMLCFHLFMARGILVASEGILE